MNNKNTPHNYQKKLKAKIKLTFTQNKNNLLNFYFNYNDKIMKLMQYLNQ